MTKIALISDIHFGKYARSKEFCPDGIQLQDNTLGASPIKEGLVKVLKEEKIDYLFVAGDLTSTGSPLEYDECYSTLLSIAKEATIAEENIIACLGNHDVDWRISDIPEKEKDCNAEASKEKFKKYYRKIAAYAAELIINKNSFTENGPAPFSGFIDNKKFIFFVLNSGWCSHRDDEIPHGKISETQLSWFKEKAGLYANDNKWKILLLHHHPYVYPYHYFVHDTSFLEEGSELLSIAGECGFNIICHGHRHHPKAHLDQKNEWKSAITLICAGSFSVNSVHRNGGDIPNCFHIVELQDDEKKIFKLKNYEYSSSEGWQALKINRPEAPLDSEMYFYKTFSNEEREKKLISLAEQLQGEQGCTLPDWTCLPIELKTLTYKKLNELIAPLLSKINENLILHQVKTSS